MVATMVLLSPVAVVSTSNRTNRPPLVGNGGYAPYFDWNTHSDALTLHWTDAPTTAFSIEFWYMVTDPYLYGTTLLSYGVYNAEGRHSAGSGVYEQANEVRATPLQLAALAQQPTPLLQLAALAQQPFCVLANRTDTP